MALKASITIAAARIALGSIFLMFGVNGFYTFIPIPEFHPFMTILVASGYIYVIETVEVLCGALLLVNRYVPLSVVLLAPDIANIAAYHALLDHRNWPIVVVNVMLLVVLLYAYRAYLMPLLVKRASAQTRANEKP